MSTPRPPRHHATAPPVAPPDRRGLRIEVVSAVGHGQTPLSSFDDALRRCGVPNYNLLPLTSVIPPGSAVVALERCERPPEEFGHKLYVVKAETRSAEPGAVVAAGIGWAQWGDGRGVMAEHALAACGGSCEAAEAALVAQLRVTLHDLCAGRGIAFDEARVGSQVAVARVGRQPATALALAVYQSEGWR